MNRLGRSCVALLLACVAAVAAPCAETTVLDDYLAGLATWSASFTQSAVDAEGRPVAGGHGSLLVVRPGRFRWESTPEGASGAAQLLVADGRNLWFLDRDLDQATVKPLSEALAQSPAMLLAGGVELRAGFKITDAGAHDGFKWVRAQPKDAASDFREWEFGFRGKELARLLAVDKLGQRSTLKFTDVKRNAQVPQSMTEFVLPPGVDLIGKPVAP